MKKITVSCVLLFCLLTLQKVYAQKFSVEGCSSIKLNEKYVLGNLIYGDADYLYFTSNATLRNDKYLSPSVNGLLKYDKNMKEVARVSMSELFGEIPDNFTFYSPKIIGGNFVFITKHKDKESKKLVFSSLVVDKNFNRIVPRKQFYILEKDYYENPGISYSGDSTSLLLTFERYTSNSNLQKAAVEKTFCGIGKNGELEFNKTLTLTPDRKEPEFILQDVLYANSQIYLYFKNVWLKKTLGISPKTGERIKDGYLYKYNPVTATLTEIGAESDLSNNYINSAMLRYANHNVYLIGTFNDEMGFGGTPGGRFGYFLMAFDKNDKVVQSDYTLRNEEEKTRGTITGVFFKSDGSVYMVTEFNFCYSYCNSNELTVFNYDVNGKLTWSKVIDKKHHGGNYLNDNNFLYPFFFSYNDNMYILFNDSKDNALSPVDKPLTETKVWGRGLYCLAYTITPSGNVTKKSLFNSDDMDCKFFTNRIFYNNYLRKVYSLGGETLLILNYE